MDGCSGRWTLNALDAVREILGERPLTEKIEAFAQVESSLTQKDDSRKGADYKTGAALRRIKAEIGNIKPPPSVRLGLTIAAGVLGGLLAYRLLASALTWLTLGWDAVTEQQQAMLRVAMLALLCAAASFPVRALAKVIKQAKQLRIAKAAEAEEQQRILRNAKALNRQAQLSKFLKWMQLAEQEGISYLSPDSVMKDPQSQTILESMRRKSTEWLLDIVVRNDCDEWSEVARGLARQILLYRAKSPDFPEAMERFQRVFAPHLAA